MKNRGRQLEVNASKIVRKAALVIDQAVVTSTPVDTGRARSNWQVQLNAAPEGTIESYVPGEGGSTGAQNTAAAIEQAKAEVANFKEGEIHITNNLPYIGRLNQGSSAQAPANFVQTAIQQGVSAVRNSRLLN
jgi:hypothetical protein